MSQDDENTDNYIKEGFPLDIEWYIFDHDSGWDNIVVANVGRS